MSKAEKFWRVIAVGFVLIVGAFLIYTAWGIKY